MSKHLEFQLKDLIVPDWVEQRVGDYIDSPPHWKRGVDIAHLRRHADIYRGFLALFEEWLSLWNANLHRTGAGDLARFRRAIEQLKAAGVVASTRAVMVASPRQGSIIASRAEAVVSIINQTGERKMRKILLLEIAKQIYTPEVAHKIFESIFATLDNWTSNNTVLPVPREELVSAVNLERAVELAFVTADFPSVFYKIEADKHHSDSSKITSLDEKLSRRIKQILLTAFENAVLFAAVNDILRQQNADVIDALGNAISDAIFEPNAYLLSRNGFWGWKDFYKHRIDDIGDDANDEYSFFRLHSGQLIASIWEGREKVTGYNALDVELIDEEINRELEIDSQHFVASIFPQVGAMLRRKLWETTGSEQLLTNFNEAVEALTPNLSKISDLFEDSWKHGGWELPGQFSIRRWNSPPVLDAFLTDLCGFEFENPYYAGLSAGFRGICESVSFCQLGTTLGAIGCDHPAHILTNTAVQLHSEQKKAIEWADGWGVYALDGVAFPKDLWTKIVRREITVSEIAQIENPAQRAAASKYSPSHR